MTLLVLLTGPNDLVSTLAQAWSNVHAMPLLLDPDEIIALGTAAVTAELVAATTDDADAWTVDSSVGTPGRVAQLFSVEAGSLMPDDQRLAFIGYGSDSTGEANKGVALYVWNVDEERWDIQGSNAAGASSSDADKTITASAITAEGDYIDADGVTYLMVVTSYAGTVGLTARLETDLLNMVSFTLSDGLTAASVYESVATGRGATFEGGDGNRSSRYEARQS